MADAKIAYGSFRRNDDKRHEQSPDVFGSITFEQPVARGTKLNFAGWTKKGDDGKTWVSVSLTPPRNAAPASRPEPRYDEGLSDDLPY